MIVETTNPETSRSKPALSPAAAMQDAVDGIITRLDGANVAYCLLRNRDRIPWDLIDGSAVCLLIQDSVTTRKLIDLLADMNPAQVSPRRDGLITFFFPVGDHMLRVDAYTRDIEWRGVILRKNGDVLADRRNDNGIMVASPVDQAFISWIERLVKGKIKERYTAQIAEALHAHGEILRHLIDNAVGTELSAQLVQLLETGRLEESRKLIPACRRAVWARGLRRHPLQTMWRGARHVTNAVESRLRPAGVSMALLGPDGAGKSTLTSYLLETSSKKLPVADVDYVAFHRLMLPTVQMLSRRMKIKNHSARNSSANPYGKPALNPLAWFAYYSYHTLDYWLSDLILNRQQESHANLVLHDRHPVEIPLDARRYRYKGPTVLPRLIARLVPQPDFIVVLDAPAEVIQSRKQEVTFEQTARQVAAYRAFAAGARNTHLVDATQPAAKVQRDVTAIITGYIAARTRRRFGLPEPVKAPAALAARKDSTANSGAALAPEHRAEGRV